MENNTTSSQPQNANRNNSRHNFRRHNDSGTDVKGFVGETPKLDAVLVLLTERVDKGTSFEKFQERLKTYALKNFKNAKDVIGLIINMDDPKADFQMKYAPKDLDVTEANNLFVMKMWKLRAKIYVDREEMLGANIHRIYALVLGQCTPALRTTLKEHKDYEDKSKVFNAKWLLERVKEITAGLDMNSNTALCLHEQVLSFFNIRQGMGESDDEYVQRFNA